MDDDVTAMVTDVVEVLEVGGGTVVVVLVTVATTDIDPVATGTHRLLALARSEPAHAVTGSTDPPGGSVLGTVNQPTR